MQMTRTQFGRRAFSALCGAAKWNSLLPAIRTVDSSTHSNDHSKQISLNITPA